MIKNLSTPTPPKLYGPEYSAWREKIGGITTERLRELFVYNDSNPAAPLVRINRKRGGVPKEGRITDRYRRTLVGGARYPTARLVFVYYHGPIPETMEVDHINRDPQDNRIENLRLVSSSDNKRNRGVSGQSEYRGISWNTPTGKWHAQLKVNGKRVHIGYYDTEIEASAAFDAAQRLYFGADHTHPSNTSEGLIDQDMVDQLPIGNILPIRKALGVSIGDWRKAQQAQAQS